MLSESMKKTNDGADAKDGELIYNKNNNRYCDNSMDQGLEVFHFSIKVHCRKEFGQHYVRPCLLLWFDSGTHSQLSQQVCSIQLRCKFLRH